MTEPIQDFIFTEISAELDYTKAMDGMAAGTFSNGWDEITFKPEELQTYVDNSMRVIRSTKTESGEIVGLPIDKDAHDHQGGAGWIVGMSVAPDRDVIRFNVKWTALGLDLIANNIRRFFSPSVDILNKVIVGGSLTNYPASRNSKGQIMLRPVELSLSSSLKEFDMQKGFLEAFKETLGEWKDEMIAAFSGAGAQPPAGGNPNPPAPSDPIELTQDDKEISPTLKAYLADPEGAEALGQLAENRARAMVAEEKRKMKVVDFASTLCGGTKERPFGLPVPPKRVVAVLLSLPDKQATEVMKLLDLALTSAIKFAEFGFDDGGFINRPKLPENIAILARQFCAIEGNTIHEFFRVNPEVGKIEEFDVSEFIKKQEA